MAGTLSEVEAIHFPVSMHVSSPVHTIVIGISCVQHCLDRSYQLEHEPPHNS